MPAPRLLLVVVLGCAGCHAVRVGPGPCAAANSGVLSTGMPALVQPLDSAPGVVAGSVHEALTGAPVRGATVEVDPGSHRMATDSAGGFRFTGLSRGAKTISARRYDYEPQYAAARLDPGTGVELAFQLTLRRCDATSASPIEPVRKPGVIPRSAPPRIP